MGRRKGSKNKNYEDIIVADPGRCPRCNGTDFEYIAPLKTTHYKGKVYGRPYSVIKRSKVKCKRCPNRYYVRMQYLLPADKKPSTNGHSAISETETMENNSQN